MNGCGSLWPLVLIILSLPPLFVSTSDMVHGLWRVWGSRIESRLLSGQRDQSYFSDFYSIQYNTHLKIVKFVAFENMRRMSG